MSPNKSFGGNAALVLVLLLSLMVAVALSACGGDGAAEDEDGSLFSRQSDATPAAGDEDEEDGDDSPFSPSSDTTPTAAAAPEGSETIADQIATGQTTAETDRAVLTAIFQATGGQDWKNNTNWLGGLSLDQWHGTTTDDNGRVTALDLTGNNLSGTIPPEIGALTSLTHLRVGGNQLEGCLPASLQQQLDIAESELPGLYFCCVGPETAAASAPTPPPEQPSLETDREALMAIFEATDGSSWDYSGEWGSLNPISEWPGVTIGYPAWITVVNEHGNQVGVNHDLSGLGQVQRQRIEAGQEVFAPEGEAERVVALNINLDGQEIPPEVGHLTGLKSLTLNGFTGALPPELGYLENLEVLDLQHNRLTGAIPPELGNLKNLKLLLLNPDFQRFDGRREGERNQLTGEIPPELGDLENLHTLQLNWNRLCGRIPPELGNLASLATLDLAGNQLSGEVPPELGSLGSDLVANRPHWQPYTAAGKVFLWKNRLWGEVPDNLGRPLGVHWHTLGLTGEWQTVVLSGNHFSGCVSDYMNDAGSYGGEGVTGRQREEGQGVGGLPACEVEDDPADKAALVALYQATGDPGWHGWGRGPIGQWQGVSVDREGRVVALAVSFPGDIPPEIGALANLEILKIDGVAGEGAIPPELGNLVNLKALYIQGLQGDGRLWTMSGEIPPEMGNLVNLKSLHITNAGLSGKLLPQWEQMDGLSVGFRGTGLCKSSEDVAFSGYANLCSEREAAIEVLSSLGAGDVVTFHLDMDMLNGIDLDHWVVGTRAYGAAIGGEMDDNGHLVEIYMRDLRGTLSPAIGKLTNLRSLHLQGFGDPYLQIWLIGEIPPELGNLVNLETLTINANLTGEIPAELGNLVKLRSLALGNNRLTGEIPPELGNLVNLETLNLWGNGLTGEIPAELGNLANLRSLELRQNQLSGDIPPELGNLPYLTMLFLTEPGGSNKFSGCIPANLYQQILEAREDDPEYWIRYFGVPSC